MPVTAAESRSMRRLARAAWVCAALFGFCATVSAQPVGNVVHVQGIASAQKPGEPARFIQKGDPLNL